MIINYNFFIYLKIVNFDFAITFIYNYKKNYNRKKKKIFI